MPDGCAQGAPIPSRKGHPDMTTPTTRADWATASGTPFPPEVAAEVASAIIGGSPFANSLTRDTAREGGGRVYPRVNAVTGGGWVAEGQPIPDVAIDLD